MLIDPARAVCAVGCFPLQGEEVDRQQDDGRECGNGAALINPIDKYNVNYGTSQYFTEKSKKRSL